MSAKTLLIATAALAATAATTLTSAAAPDQPGQGPGPAAQAQQKPDGPAKMSLRTTVIFSLLDRNGNGTIEKEELDAVRDALFAAIDADSDGKITKEEIMAIGPMMGGGPRRGGPDMNRGDHRMGRGDHGGWDRHDRDGRRGPPDRQGQNDDHRGGPRDGKHGGKHDGRMGANGPGQQDGQGPRGQGRTDRFASLDKNGDGVISQDEFAAFPLPFRNLTQPE